MTQHNYFPARHVGSTAAFALAKRSLICLMALMAFSLIAPYAAAQETTATMRGTVLNPDGSPAAGIRVTITDTRTGGRRTAVTNARGVFASSGLSVGGPYTIKADSDTYADATVSEIYVALGETYTFTVSLGLNVTEEVITTAARIKTAEVAVGPSSSYDIDDLEAAPAINRDIKDLIRIDPRIYVDEADVENVHCLGASPRFNSLTVDGVKLNDNFGLNRSGYPTQRMPFPYEAIQQVAVELAPFDVEYGGFTACNINAVTKSGENEFFGSLFMDYTDDSMIGDELEGDPIPSGDFDEKRYGFSIGGPIIKDKLFFFAAYQKDETADTYDFCAGDEVCGRPVAGVTRAQLDRIRSIAMNPDKYDYDPGDILLSTPVEDEKYLIKLDWNISDKHRANFTYNFNDGFNTVRSDGDPDEYEFPNHFYNRGAQLDAYSAMLFSDWTENFSTELRASYSTLDNSQITRNAVGFPEMQIETYADVDGDGTFSRAIVYVGGDDSRQSNKLDYETNSFKLAGTYTKGNHTLSGGFERDYFDVTNLFLQHSIGEYRFDERCGSSNPDLCIDKFDDLSPDDIYYGNAAGTNNPQDAAGAFDYSINTVYLQDEYAFADDALRMVFGLRYDWYSSNDLPRENANFVARNGFSNATNFDEEGLLQPRFGFSWDATDNLSLRGGIGLYSGGNPNVWLTNNYQVDGITQIQLREFNVGLSNLNSTCRFLGGPDCDVDGDGNPDPGTAVQLSGGGRPGYDIPQAYIDAVATGSADSSVNAMDPNFKIPANWKFALGGTWSFDLPGNLGSGYTLNADAMFTKSRNSAIIEDATLARVGTAPDGRPIYRQVDKSDPDCATSPATCSSRAFTQDFILTNVKGSDAQQTSYSLALSKSYDFGLDWTIAYAYTEAEDVNPMTSSVAFSNYVSPAVTDPNNPGLGISNYQIPNRFTLRVDYQKAFFSDYETRFTLFGSRNEGRPFSYTFDNDDGDMFGDRLDRRHLVYVPTGPSDPKVNFDPGFDTNAFFAFVSQSGLAKYAGSIAPRNVFDSNWWTKFDLRISQDIPGFREDHRAKAYFVIENVGNLLNDDWGVLREAGFPRKQAIVDAEIDSPTTYLFESFNAPSGQSRVTSPSLWAMRIGVKYNF